MHVTTVKAMKQFKPWKWLWQTAMTVATNISRLWHEHAQKRWLVVNLSFWSQWQHILKSCRKEQTHNTGGGGKEMWLCFVFVLIYLAVSVRCPAASKPPVAIELSYRSVAMNALQCHKSPPATSRRTTGDMKMSPTIPMWAD